MSQSVISKRMPITVVIPTMNRPESLRRTVRCYMTQAWIPSQIIVVDQSQTEEEQQANKAALYVYKADCDIQYHYQPISSLTKARNTALPFVREEILVFSDDDVDVEAETLKNLTNIMKRSDVAMVAGTDINAGHSSTNIGYLLGSKSFINRKIGHVTLSMLGRYPDEIIGEVKTQWAMGYFFAIRKSLMEKWHLKWDENLVNYAYAEDLDFSYSYCKLANACHMSCILSDKVKVAHLASKEYRIPSRKSTFMYVLNRAYLSHKYHMGWRSCAAMNWCDFWRMVERMLRHQNPQDLRDAYKYLRRHKNNVYNGNIGNIE